MSIWDIVILIILIVFAFNGYRQGFIKALFSMIALILIVVVTFIVTPYVADFLKTGTPLHAKFKSDIYSGIDVSYDDSVSVEQILEELKLPPHVKNAVIENSIESAANKIDNAIHEAVDSNINIVKMQVADYLANIGIFIVAAVITFILASIIIGTIVHVADLFAKLPVLNSVNKIAGIAVGLLQGIVLIWILSLFLSFFPSVQGFSNNTVRSVSDNFVNEDAAASKSIEHRFYNSNPLWSFIKLDF